MATEKNQTSEGHLHALSLLLLSPQMSGAAVHHVDSLNSRGLDEFFKLADIHHVVIRALKPLARSAASCGHNEIARRAQEAVGREQERINKAVASLEAICIELEAEGCSVAVMKTLDHWPDFGNDLDLVTMADERHIESVFVGKFGGRLLTRSVGDHLAHKRSFEIPGLRETVEIHVGRLGPAGEHRRLARRFLDRRVRESFNGSAFFLPAAEERLIEGTLERMYRHFYFRLCDIQDTARIVASGALNYDELRRAADLGGIWAGVATNLRIASDYVRQYRGASLQLPGEVVAAALCGGDELIVRSKYLWVPILSQGIPLFTRQFAQLVKSGNISATARLSLLPPLAGMAALAYAVGANSERIW